MVPAYSHAHWAFKMTKKLRFTFGIFLKIIFCFFESLWGYRYVVPPWGHFSSSSSFLSPYVFTLGFASQFGQFA